MNLIPATHIQHKYVESLKLPMCEPYSTPSFHRDAPKSPFLLYNIQLTLNLSCQTTINTEGK